MGVKLLIHQQVQLLIITIRDTSQLVSIHLFRQKDYGLTLMAHKSLSFYLIHQTKQVAQTAHATYTVHYELGQTPADGSKINLPADNVQKLHFYA